MTALSKNRKISLLVLDIDNTIFDWVSYYTNSFWAMLENVSNCIQVPAEQLASEARLVFESHGSIEYPFVIQELPSVDRFYGDDIDRMLQEAVEPSRQIFLDIAKQYLFPYEGVRECFAQLRQRFPDVPRVALTDAPRYVAMWKLNKLGLLSDFSAVYGLADPRIPTCDRTQRVKVNPRILLKHLQQSNFGFAGKIRILPDEYEKPGTRGLKTVLMDFEMDEDDEHRHHVLWVGDNLRKDVKLGQKLGVRTAWAKYGASVKPDLLSRLNLFSPPQNIHKNASMPVGGADTPNPDIVLEKFGDLIEFMS
jgi:phosphoglycolate phosphatase-like HAD superfamily hydrolase